MPNKRTLRETVLCALFAALIAVGGFLRIPTPILVLTLQTLFVVLAGLVLGARLGAAAAAVYLMTGLVGLPVFTQGGGPGYVLSPTFGYLVGFIAGAWTAGKLAEKLKPGFWAWFWAGAAAIAVIYAIGIPYFYFVSRYHLGNDLGARTLLFTFILMPLPGDLLSCLAAAALVKRLRAFFP